MDRLASDRMFVAVMETGSFAEAARRLGTSSGQASKLVSGLEQRLGTRLLHRTTRALAPTELGQVYFEQIRTLLAELEALDQSLQDAGARPRGRLRLTAPLTFGTMELAHVLNQFATDYPEIALEVSFSDRMVNLVDEGFDAAIRIGTPEDSSLVARRLRETRGLLVASDAYLERRGVPQVPEDLAEHDCIIDTNRRPPHLWRLRDTAVTVSGRLTYSNAAACLDAAEQGLGIAYLPDFVASHSLIAQKVQRLMPEHEAPPFGIYALYPTGRHLARKVRVLVDFLALKLAGPATPLP